MLSCLVVAAASLVTAFHAQPAKAAPPGSVEAHVQPHAHRVPTSRPIWVRFALENTSDLPVTLTVPGVEPDIPSPQSGLPVEHIFSSGLSSSLAVTTEAGRRWDSPTGYRPSGRAPILMIAPHSRVSTSLDLRRYFPVLRGAGIFRITWSPYQGAVPAKSAVITIATLKRAEIVTDEGIMTLRFFYADAPAHVDNFIELAESNFYDDRLFHRIEPGYLVQGGCPRDDGTGIRPDGKRLAGEFNGHLMTKGSVAMALLDDDPDSASCQFFICNTREKEWDGKYTIFAELVGERSFATLDRLMQVPVDGNGRPTRPVRMRTVRIIDAPPDDGR